MYYDEIRELMVSETGRTTRRGTSGTKLRMAGVVIGLAGGLTSGIVGAFLTFTSWLTWSGALQHYEHSIGTVLLVVTIPFLVLGAHCLDLIERTKNE